MDGQAFDLGPLAQKVEQRRGPSRGRLLLLVLVLLAVSLLLLDALPIAGIAGLAVTVAVGLLGWQQLRAPPSRLELSETGVRFLSPKGGGRSIAWADPHLRLVINDRRETIASRALGKPEVSQEGNETVYRYPEGGVVRVGPDRVIARRADGVTREFSGFTYRMSRATVESVVGGEDAELALVVRFAWLRDAYVSPEAYDALRTEARRHGLRHRALEGRPPPGLSDGRLFVIAPP